MPSIDAAKSTVDSFQPSYTPVAVFIGGTSGVGEAMVKRLGQSLNGNIHLIIVGRNKKAAESTLSVIPKPATHGSLLREFVSCDASLMANIEVACDEIKHLIGNTGGGKLNFLVNSAGYASLTPVPTTKDGLDDQVVMRYYNRWKFTDELLPLVQKARDAGEAANVMSILAGGHKNTWGIPEHDFGLLKSWVWSRSMKGALVTVAYNDLMMEELAERHPGIAFTHIFPGMVNTPAVSKTFAHWGWTPFRPLIWLMNAATLIPAEHSCEWMLFGLVEGKAGFYSRNDHGDDVAKGKPLYASSSARKALWQHTKETVRSRTSYS